MNPRTFSADDIDGMCERLLKLSAANTDTRTVVSLAGIPGSGKSTIAAALAKKLGSVAAILPQDGFHWSREHLTTLDDPEEAFRCRGAPFTFDSRRFVEKVAQLKLDSEVHAPSFDHALKDPVEKGVYIGPEVKIVIVEGSFVSLADEIWTEIEAHVDESWFVDVDLGVARERVIARHLASGISNTLQEAQLRTDGNDLVNARYIVEHSKLAEVIIQSN